MSRICACYGSEAGEDTTAASDLYYTKRAGGYSPNVPLVCAFTAWKWTFRGYAKGRERRFGAPAQSQLMADSVEKLWGSAPSGAKSGLSEYVFLLFVMRYHDIRAS